MSFYNMVNGVNSATFFFLPMLGKHPDEWPRFRDCFIGKPKFTVDKASGMPVTEIDIPKNGDKLIYVFTRTGGGNRESYMKEIEEIKKMKGYIEDFDDSFDQTFMTFVFKVPAKFEKDYDLVYNGKMTQTSKEYQETVLKVYPKLKTQLTDLFSGKGHKCECEGCKKEKKNGKAKSSGKSKKHK